MTPLPPRSPSASQRLRDGRDEDRVRQCLEALSKAAAMTESTSDGADPNNLLHLSVEATRARCVTTLSTTLSTPFCPCAALPPTGPHS